MKANVEPTRLHRLTADEAALIFDFRLLSPDTKRAIAEVARSMTCNPESLEDNVVNFRDAD
jgi:hypothetical protein